MARETLLKGQDSRLGRRRVYMPIIGWDYTEPPPDIKPVVSGTWWMGYRLIEEQDDASNFQERKLRF